MSNVRGSESQRKATVEYRLEGEASVNIERARRKKGKEKTH